jgi:hypothetical protein
VATVTPRHHLCGRCQSWHAADEGCEFKVRTIEPTPEQLAQTSPWTAADWHPAYAAQNWREDWPEIAAWAIRNSIHPARIEFFAQALTPPDPPDFDALFGRRTRLQRIVDWLVRVPARVVGRSGHRQEWKP